MKSINELLKSLNSTIKNDAKKMKLMEKENKKQQAIVNKQNKQLAKLVSIANKKKYKEATQAIAKSIKSMNMKIMHQTKKLNKLLKDVKEHEKEIQPKTSMMTVDFFQKKKKKETNHIMLLKLTLTEFHTYHYLITAYLVLVPNQLQNIKRISSIVLRMMVVNSFKISRSSLEMQMKNLEKELNVLTNQTPSLGLRLFM